MRPVIGLTPPTYSPPLDLVTTAALSQLRATGRVVFDSVYARVPELVTQNAGYAADPMKPPYPYGIFYSLPGGSSDLTPDLAVSRKVVELAFQVTAVSNLRNQCQATGRLFRDRLLARTRDGFVHDLPMPTDWECTDRTPDGAMPGVDVSGDATSRVYSQPFRFYLTISRV